MAEIVNVKLSIEQVRLLRDVTIFAATDAADQARQTKSLGDQKQMLERCERLKHLAEIFEKTAP